MSDPKTTLTVTITGCPVNVNSQQLLADAVVTVDFAELAADLIRRAAFSARKKATMRSGAIVVQAANLRPRK